MASGSLCMEPVGLLVYKCVGLLRRRPRSWEWDSKTPGARCTCFRNRQTPPAEGVQTREATAFVLRALQ